MKLTIELPHDEVLCEHIMGVAHEIIYRPGNEHMYPAMFTPEEWAEMDLCIVPSNNNIYPGEYAGHTIVAEVHDDNSGTMHYSELWAVTEDGTYYPLTEG